MRNRSRAFLIAVALCVATLPAGAFPRSPQVPISGNGLQLFFDGYGQSIDVHADQEVLPAFEGTPLIGPWLVLATWIKEGNGALALYNAFEPGSPLFEVLPDGLPPGWYSTAAFQGARDLQVQLLDDQDVQQQLWAYPGTDIDFLVNFAVTDANGTFFADDSRNPGGEARLLAYRGTGAELYNVWIAAESDGDGDFDDAVFLLWGMATVSTQRTSWGTLKKRFR